MEIHKIKSFDMTMYKEVLPNGLEIYVLPNEKASNIHVTFSTRFGSFHREFIPKGEDKMIKSPAGIAHFLEHKMFEQETGEDPFTFYEKRGIEANANTTFYKTTYLFSGKNNFEECLSYLIDYVQSPYFTDENVEKEKGIITQEIKMVADSPYAKGVDEAIKNCFHDFPLCDTVLGEETDINQICKEDLYRCYHTFYQPSNMFLVITGNVNPQKAIELIKKNQEKKTFPLPTKIIQKEYHDEKTVYQTEETIYKNIEIPKLVTAYKIDVSHKNGFSNQEIDWCIELFLELMFGITSSFSEEVKKKQILMEEIEYTTLRVNDKMIILFIADTFQLEKLMTSIDKTLHHIQLDEQEFLSKKRKRIADSIYMSDDIYGLNNYVMADIIKYQEFSYDFLEKLKNISFAQFQSIIQQLSFDNKTIVKICPKKTK